MDVAFIYLLAGVFFLIAVLYSSVGFGGGSLYLALLALSSIEYSMIRPIALVCNIIVVTSGVYIHYKHGLIDFRKSLVFVAASIPLAFIGGLWQISEHAFFVILGFSLIAASVLLWIEPREGSPVNYPQRPLMNGFLGGGIGLLSGLVGIGGGIFLSPVLHFLHWDSAKKISALASVFILANSVSGLTAVFLHQDPVELKLVIPLALAVFAGGQIGSRFGASQLKAVHIKRLTAVVILIAGVSILREHL